MAIIIPGKISREIKNDFVRWNLESNNFTMVSSADINLSNVILAIYHHLSLYSFTFVS